MSHRAQAPPTGILHSGPQNKDAKVTINAPAGKERSTKDHPAPPPNPAQVSAPIVNAPVKDEVELLRQGIMNKHGEHVKPQGSANNN